MPPTYETTRQLAARETGNPCWTIRGRPRVIGADAFRLEVVSYLL